MTASKHEQCIWQTPPLSTLNSARSRLPDWALRDLETLEKEVKEAAYAQGYSEGRIEGEKSLQENQNELESLIGILGKPAASIENGLYDVLLDLGGGIAKQLLLSSPEYTHAYLCQAIEQAVGQLQKPASPPVLHLCPDDAQLIMNADTQVALPEGWSIEENAALESGQCRIESGHSVIIADLVNRIACLLDSLKQEARPEPEIALVGASQ